jgi:hypothetical protein
MNTEDYGQYYWCVKSQLSPSGEIYLYADEVEFTAAGGVIFWRVKKEGEHHPNLSIAAGQWSAVYAASCWNGAAVAVEHWDGEVTATRTQMKLQEMRKKTSEQKKPPRSA